MASTVSPKHFDHTLLKPAASKAEIKRICKEARQYGFYSVCVNPVQVKRVRALLAGSEVKICSVVGFPLGASTSYIKAKETEQAILDGADEIDMVMNVSGLKDGEYDYVEQDIQAVVHAADTKIVKVIIETCLLKKQEIIKACEIVSRAGADFVKTSTGFAGGGALPEDVMLMKQTVGDKLQIKASGGIKSLSDAVKMIESGADRIGASAGVDIMEELQNSPG